VVESWVGFFWILVMFWMIFGDVVLRMGLIGWMDDGWIGLEWNG
jgi:hypothetical protein